MRRFRRPMVLRRSFLAASSAAAAMFTVLTVALSLPSGSLATEYENDDDDRNGHVPVVAHEIFVLGPEEEVHPALVRTDLDYIAGMVPHHQGAVTMSRDYLADPRGTNPILRKMARAIIANQRFEIAMLDEIRRRLETSPQTVADFGFARIVRRGIGIDGLEHQWQFVKRRPPGFLDLALAPGLEASARDVKFSREMMIHHQAAVDMARSYNTDPNGTNRILKRLNFDIIVDQTYEIAFLEGLLERYPGDPNAVKIDDMIPGMEHMQMDHGEGSMGHGMGH
jgi:uncharacterized protein (DUF305 family)